MPPTPPAVTPFYFFMYSLGLPYLWPQYLFDKWGYDNPIYSPKSQHPFQLYSDKDQQSNLSLDD